MALESTFQRLNGELWKMRDRLMMVQLTVMEDLPEQQASALADQIADAIVEARGLLEEALAESSLARQAVGHPTDLERARRSLANIHAKHHRLGSRFVLELASYTQLSELARLGRARGGEWLPWANTVKEGLERCQPQIFEINQALFECWQEIAERVGMNSISVQATNIGQQIRLPEKERKVEEELDGM